MIAPKVFISHSATRDDTGVTRSLLTKLKAALEEEGWQVLDDAELLAGQEWRSSLHSWMGLCHAAILLFSRAAVYQSDWVLKEATIFYWRHSLTESFELIPVLLPNVTKEELVGGRFAAVDAASLQYVDMHDGDADRGVREVLSRLAPLKNAVGNAPLEVPIRLLAERLSKLSEATLRAICARLNLELPAAVSKQALVSMLAAELLHLDCEKCVNAFVGEIAGYLLREEAERMINILAPFWFDPLPVARIPRGTVAPHDQPKPALGIKGRRRFIGRMYVNQASCRFPPGWFVVSVNNDAGPDEFGRLKTTIWKSLEQEFMRNFEVEDLREMLRVSIDFELRQGPLFIVITGGVGGEALERLRAEFKEFNVIIVGQDPPAQGVVSLSPDPPPGAEDLIEVAYNSAISRCRELRSAD